MDKARRKKINYIPGIISLTILPFLFIHFAGEVIDTKSIVAMPLVLADTNLPKEFPEVFKKFKNKYPPERNYTDILFTGNEKSDKIKLDFAQVRIREILSGNDSVDGLHFQFGDSSQYWSFVKTVDILRNEGAKTFMPLDNDLWFYHFPPDTSSTKYFICGTHYELAIGDERWRTKLWQQTKLIWTTSWQIILLFLAFLLSIFIKRQVRDRQ